MIDVARLQAAGPGARAPPGVGFPPRTGSAPEREPSGSAPRPARGSTSPEAPGRKPPASSSASTRRVPLRSGLRPGRSDRAPHPHELAVVLAHADRDARRREILAGDERRDARGDLVGGQPVDLDVARARQPDACPWSAPSEGATGRAGRRPPPRARRPGPPGRARPVRPWRACARTSRSGAALSRVIAGARRRCPTRAGGRGRWRRCRRSSMFELAVLAAVGAAQRRGCCRIGRRRPTYQPRMRSSRGQADLARDRPVVVPLVAEPAAQLELGGQRHLQRALQRGRHVEAVLLERRDRRRAARVDGERRLPAELALSAAESVRPRVAGPARPGVGRSLAAVADADLAGQQRQDLPVEGQARAE